MKKQKMLKMISMFLVFVALFGITSSAQSQAFSGSERLDEALHQYEIAITSDDTGRFERLDEAVSSSIEERKAFYAEYFQQGLHSELLKIESSFELESIEQLEKNLFQVREEVVLTAKPILQVAKDYPVYQATLLAAEMMEDVGKAKYLQSNARDILHSVEESILSGTFQITIINTHLIRLDSDMKQIIADEFTSKSNDDAGTDTVVWENGKARRVLPDYEKMPDNIIYRKSIKELAQEIYEDMKEASLSPRTGIDID